MREELILLAIVEILLGVAIFFASYPSYFYEGKGYGFKVYVACVCVFNIIVALNN